MLGESITITVNAVAKTLRRINQDNYSAEYYLRETTGLYQLFVRHSDEKGLISGRKMERHNVELRYTKFATGVDLEMTTIVATTIRNAREADSVAVDQLSDGLADWIKSNGVLLVQKES